MDEFADAFLAKCTPGQMISRYMVLVASEQKLMDDALFIDARKISKMISRVQAALDDDAIRTLLILLFRGEAKLMMERLYARFLPQCFIG